MLICWFWVRFLVCKWFICLYLRWGVLMVVFLSNDLLHRYYFGFSLILLFTDFDVYCLCLSFSLICDLIVGLGAYVLRGFSCFDWFDVLEFVVDFNWLLCYLIMVFTVVSITLGLICGLIVGLV